MHEGTHDFHACREHDFEVHHFFPKLKKLALRCIDVHFQCWISSGWFVVFYVTSKLLEEGGVDGSSYFMLHPNYLKRVVFSTGLLFRLTIFFGYSSFTYWWLKIVVFVFEMLISRWYFLKEVDNALRKVS